jgi:vacuolar-type H+-ATPase subunit E/Vma4
MTDSSDTIKQMIKLIDQEAREKADSIVEDGRHRMQIEKNKIYKEEREKLIKLYKKKEDDEIVRAKTTKSRIINENRLKIQNNRNTYVEKLKAEIC